MVNALLIPYLLSAIRMFESGIASREDIDNGMELGCAHPMGPLKLSDLIGLDTVASVADSMYDEYKEPLYAAPPLLQRMVDAGRLGRKSGSGFYPYADRAADPQPLRTVSCPPERARHRRTVPGPSYSHTVCAADPHMPVRTLSPRAHQGS